uniref:Uncharacterized protein n=1 Tax=Parascaris equorum TaxID=6256 RepID=A0A914RE85_PAREQ
MPREMRNELARKMRAHVGPPMMMPRPYGPPQPLMVFPHAPARPWFGMMDPGRRAETSEDRHDCLAYLMYYKAGFRKELVKEWKSAMRGKSGIIKYEEDVLIYPDEAQLAAVEKLVAMIEKALKGV